MKIAFQSSIRPSEPTKLPLRHSQGGASTIHLRLAAQPPLRVEDPHCPLSEGQGSHLVPTETTSFAHLGSLNPYSVLMTVCAVSLPNFWCWFCNHGKNKRISRWWLSSRLLAVSGFFSCYFNTHVVDATLTVFTPCQAFFVLSVSFNYERTVVSMRLGFRARKHWF